MIGEHKMTKVLVKLIAILFLTIFLLNPIFATGILQEQQSLVKQATSVPSLKSSVSQELSRDTSPVIRSDDEPGVNDPYIPEDYDITKFLMNNEMATYQKVWEPWLTKAAVRCIATDPKNEWIAVGGGYLYDNEIHLYRWNDYTREYDKVWDTGDQIIQGDVLSIDFGDTDHNGFLELVCGSADGHVYVFEQEHIYDPFDNMENQFVHVWTSPKLQQVWGVKIADVDKDYLPDIIAGSWDGKVHIYEYTNHSGYPFSKQHWIEYTEKTTIDVGEKIFSIATGDTNYNALPEIIVGTEMGRVYIYENNGTILKINGEPWPLTHDNSYRYHWDTGNTSWKPILRIIVDQLDDDLADEIVYISVGQNVFVVNWDATIGISGQYLTHQLWEPLDSWELGGLEGLGHYLNHYIDWMTWSNNNNTGNDDEHVYNDEGAYRVLEPYPYPWMPQWPKNTSMAITRKLDPWGEGLDAWIDGVHFQYDTAENYTTFDALDTLASAIVDWGNDGEVMGDGLWAIPEADLGYDVMLRFHWNTIPNLNKISFEISQGDGEWALIPEKDISLAHVAADTEDDDLWIDIDPILSKNRWAYFRYMRINVTNNGYFKIKGGYAPILYRPMDTATSITIGNLDLSYYKAYTTGVSEGKKIVLGTSDGKIIMFEYDSATKGYYVLWNSYKNDTYTQGTNIWDIVEVKSSGKIPTWLYNESSSNILAENLAWTLLNEGLGNFAAMDHANLVKSFFETLFGFVTDFFPGMEGIIELNIPGNDLVVGTDTGDIAVFSALTGEYSEMGTYFFISTIVDPFYADTSVSPTFVDFLENNPLDVLDLMKEETMFLSWVKNEQFYNPEVFGSRAIAGIDVYTYEFPTITLPIPPPFNQYGNFMPRFELAEREITGLLSRALEKSMNIPDIAMGDIDGDGDKDLVLTNGRIYYLENIMNNIFILEPEYFQDLNLQTTNKLYTSPELYDFDGDGDLDLSVGFSNREGATYFENIGHRWAPEWKENKWLFTNSWGGLWYNNLTSPTFAFDDYGRVSHLTTYNNYTKDIVQLKAEYENHNAFVIGTNPIIARLEMNLKSGTDSHGNMLANYGYHVFETWNTEAELARWTLTLKTGDMDQDGRGEVIVGDYDNNMYVFEHLTNNTYKRAYRGQDMTHTELSTTSPYAWQELEGVSGTFYRTIWDHIEELVIGLDMDNDGFLEMVATAGLSIFVWEQKNDGFVSIDDEYTLIWQADLKQSAWAPLFKALEIDHFTAAAFGGDLDYNGYGEFILAAGSFLFVFESNGADQFNDNFLVNPYPVRGRYFVPGNPISSPAVRTLSIEAIAVGDTDNDTLNEIIIGGVNKTLWGQYNGFVCILENQIGTYDYTWWAPNRLMEDNPVYDLTIDNQDYDHYKEIIVGTFKGIVIYENTPGSSRDNNYIERSILTSYVNFPYIKLKQMFDLEAKLPLSLRNTDLLELQYDHPEGDFHRGDWIQIFKAGNQLFWATSDDNGSTWVQRLTVTTTNLQSNSLDLTRTYYEYHPSIYQTRDGRVWLAFTAKLEFGLAASFIDEGIWLLELSKISNEYFWTNSENRVAVDGSSPAYLLYNPSVWDYHNNSDQGVAISYLNSSDGGIYWKGNFNSPTTAPLGHYGQLPNIGKDPSTNKYQAFSHDTIRSVSDKVIVVFSGRYYAEAKVDLDLWIAKSNSTPIWDNQSRYSRATLDGIDELNPSITQTVTPDHALLVIFEADGYSPSGALQITYSKDDGESWRDPEPVSTTPPFAEYIHYPQFGFSLLVLKDNPYILVTSLISVGPAITAHYEGGFAYSFMAQYNLIGLGHLSISDRTSSLKTMNRGYSSAGLPTTTTYSPGDLSAHSGMVRQIGGSLTTGGGMVSYQGEVIGSYSTSDSNGGGGSALYYAASSPPVINYNVPIVTGEEEGVRGYGGNILSYQADATGTDDPGSDENTGSGYPPGQSGGMTMAVAPNYDGFNFHSDASHKDRGYYNNIFFGMNPSSNFTLFDFKEVRALSTGDSDKDYRREIAIASGNQAYLVEVSRTGGSDDPEHQVLFYYQSWHSDGLATVTTDIELYDANGNGMDEVIVSCIEGNVYSFEGLNTKPPATNYLFLDGMGSFDPLWSDFSYNGSVSNLDPLPDVLIDTADLDQDGFDDLFVAGMDPEQIGDKRFPTIRAINGSSKETVWTVDLSAYISVKSTFINLKSVDLNLDNISDVIFIVHEYESANTSLFALDGIDGSSFWAPLSLPNGNVIEPTLVDINGDNVSDILVAYDDTVLFVRGTDGFNEEFYSFGDSTWSIEHISVGNDYLVISGRKENAPNGTVVLIDFDKTVIYESIRNNSLYGLTATLLDVTDDGNNEILIVESGVLFTYSMDENGSYVLLWNKTFDKTIGNYFDTLRYDFNSDSYQDVMFQFKTTSGNHTETFEKFKSGRLDTRVEGLIFSNTNPVVFGQGWTAWNSSGLPIWVPHSGDIVTYTYESNNYIIIMEKSYVVSAWFSTGSYNGEFIWSAYDEAGSLLDSATFTNNTPTQYVRLEDTEGRIDYVQVSGSSGSGWEGFFVMDDFSYMGRGHLTKLVTFSGIDMNPLWEYHLWDSYATEFSQGDLDRDGEPDDLLLITEYDSEYPYSGAVSAIDGTYGTPFWNIQMYGSAISVAAGNFGTFGEAAILNASCHVFIATYVRWTPTSYQKIAIQKNGTSTFETKGNVIDIAVGDFNNDGEDDVVFGDTQRYLVALEGSSGDMIWKYRTSSPIQQIAVEDINEDGYSDIAVALKDGTLVIINGRTGLVLWKDYIGPVIVNEMEFVDATGDDKKQELAISMGYCFSNLIGRFMIYNTTKDESVGHGLRLWERYSGNGPFTQFEVADFNLDGTNDFAVAVYEHSIWIFDGLLSIQKGKGTLITLIPINIQDFRVGKFFADPLPQIAVIVRNGTIAIYQGITDWSTYIQDDTMKTYLVIPFRLSHMAVGDFSGDGYDDIVVRSLADASYCLDGSNLANILWTFKDRSFFYLDKYQVADLNNDSKLDILTTNYDNIMALSGVKRDPIQVIWASFIPTNLILSTTIGDFNGDSIQDIALGTADHWVYILYGQEEYLIEQKVVSR